MKNEIKEKLEKLALARTIPFCMSCYIKAPQGICPSCHSDDLARWMDGVGLDWNLDFAIEHILMEELTPVDLDAAFEDSIRGCYPETTQVGWLNLDTVEILKSQDPISWKIACDEFIDGLESDEEIMTFTIGSTYYKTSELEALFV